MSYPDISTSSYRYWHTKNQENLDKLLADIDEYYAPPPDNVCYICGKTDSENEEDGYGPCIDFEVRTSVGEEGQDIERRYVCQEHFEELAPKLIALGFGNHKHGGIHFLEDTTCVGALSYSSCPTPFKEEE